MKKQRNTTQIKEQTRNTEVHINEEEIANYLKKNQNNDSKDDQKSGKQNEKMQESINKDLEELKRQHSY